MRVFDIDRGSGMNGISSNVEEPFHKMTCCAAYALGCTSARLYWIDDSHAGSATDTVNAIGNAIAATGDKIVLLDGRAPGVLNCAGLFEAEPGSTFSIFIATTIEDRLGSVRGVLIVADPAPRETISRAQGYVFRALAAQIGLLHELEQWRRNSAGITRDERLRLLESVVVNAKDAVLITDAEPIDLPGPKIIYCNAAFTATTGYSLEDVIGHTPRMLQSPQTDRAALDRLRGALSRWEPVEVELLNRHKDGTEFWVELSIVPVADQRGWFTHWVSVQRDVTERRRAVETRIRAAAIEAENRTLEAEIQERKRVEAQLLYAAYHDDLTRLHNRAYFMNQLRTALEFGADEIAFDGAVLFLDLDRFKLVNDSLGHRAGDQMLIEASRRIKSCIRPRDTVARLGGDEFAVLIDDIVTVADAEAVAHRIAIVMQAPFQVVAQDIFVRCSVGIVYSLRTYHSPEDLLRDADIAMYQAKKIGTGGHVVFDPQLHGGAAETLALHTDLRHALERDEFAVHFQPIVDGATARMVGIEALVRWHHPQGGMMAPGRFIAVAEEIGLIGEIDRMVLRKSCETMHELRKRYQIKDLYVSVNASSSELMDPDFVDDLKKILSRTGLAPSALQLEITESVFISHPERIRSVLNQIRDLGVRVALDDFGTGYSSLAYLDRFEIDTLKIDRSFIAKMMINQKTRMIVKTILHLGEALGLAVIAEGIETQEQLDDLIAMGCPLMQGYFLGRPVPAHDIVGIVTRGVDEDRMALIPMLMK